MPADGPTILATSGGLRPAQRSAFEFAPLIHHAVELSGVSDRPPRLCFVGTALGDQRSFLAEFVDAGSAAGIAVSHLDVFPMPNVDNALNTVLDSDVVWVGGGSVANLLALWRLHGFDNLFEQAWQAGVVLAGVSAGSLCWHVGGTTDSFGPALAPVTNGLAFLPYSNGVHYDAELERRPLFERLVGNGTIPDGYATDNGVGLVYRRTDLVEAVTEVKGAAAWSVRRHNDGVIEERIEPRHLPGAL